MRRSWRSGLFWTLTVLYWISALAIVALGAVPRDIARLPQNIQQAFGDLLRMGQALSGWIVPLAFLAGLAKLLREKLGSPWKWDLVKNVLDNLREVTFKDVASGQVEEHYRATLFKHVTFCFTSRCWLFRKWPWEGWLVTVERSGQFTLRAREAFWAPDRGESAYGVAGRTLAIGETIPIVDLPDPADEKQLDEYARRSFVTAAWVRKTQERARCYVGIPIEVRGKRWGVVVLDSRHPHPPNLVEDAGDGKIRLTKELSHAYGIAASTLRKLVEPH